MPIKRQAVKIKSTAKTAAKGRVKAKKTVSVSYGYGACKKKTGYGYKKRSASKPVKYVCKPVKSVSKKRCHKVVRKSAFRAVSSEPQTVLANTTTQVAFGQEVFDLGGEYNPVTSTFRAKQNGIYTFVASALYLSRSAEPVQVAIFVTVNGAPVFGDTETLSNAVFGRTFGIVDTSGIISLRRGDAVRVQFTASQDGVLELDIGTHFEGVLNRVIK